MTRHNTASINLYCVVMRRIPSNPLFWSLAVLLFPLLIEVTFSDFVREGEYNSRIGWSFITALLINLANHRWVTAAVLLPFMIGGLADIGYAYTFGGVFTTATIEAVIHTDSSEANEFFAAYASLPLFSLYLIHWLIYAAAINYSQAVSTKGWRRTIVTMGILLMVVVAHRTTVMGKFHDTIPGVLGTMPSYYRGAISLEKEVDLRKQLVNNTEVVANVTTTEPQTHIFIIGESLTRNHMGIYGYHRETTPELAKLENLILMDDVISSHAQTQASLRVALTAAESEDGNKYRNSLSVIDIANLAGYKTWWISNQQPQRATIASISHQADVPHYISNDYNGVEVARYDEYMQPVIEKALNDPAEKKAIFIHMMGSHAQYKNRYPDRFIHFNDENIITYRDEPSSKEVQAINDYDNSVLYSDHVVAQIIDALKDSGEGNKSLTYFSDHGEEVYRTAKIKGHGPDNVTANMIEIPLIVWSSEPVNETVLTLQENSKKPFMLDNFYQLAGSLMQIKSDALNPIQSPADKAYQADSSRKVYRLNYDTELKK